MKKIFESIRYLKRSVLVVLAGIGVLFGLLLSLPAVEALHWASSNDFCASCHTMEPMVETFKQSSHGGNNSQGFVAECVDCHIPTSNVVDQLWVKGTSGMRHMWGEFVLGMEALDYQQKHDARSEYVFDSGCVNCHKTLEERALAASDSSPESDQVHKRSFEKKGSDSDWQCSSCHFDIAHPNLRWKMREREYTRLREAAQAAQEGGI